MITASKYKGSWQKMVFRMGEKQRRNMKYDLGKQHSSKANGFVIADAQ